MAMLHVDIDARDGSARQGLDDLLRRARDPRPALDTAGVMGLRSIQRNFDAGGRPSRWQARRDGSPSHLQDSGHLQRSVHYRVTADGIKWATRHRAAALHQFGGVVRPKRGKWLAIPVGRGRRSLTGAGLGALMRRVPDQVRLVFHDGARGSAFWSPDGKGDGELLFVLRRKVTMPARPFLLLQGEDTLAMADVFGRHLEAGW